MSKAILEVNNSNGIQSALFLSESNLVLVGDLARSNRATCCLKNRNSLSVLYFSTFKNELCISST